MIRSDNNDFPDYYRKGVSLNSPEICLLLVLIIGTIDLLLLVAS